MYPPSNNNCNNNSIFSSLLQNIPSPSIQYDHELYFQYYHDNYLQQHLIEDLDILADTEMAISQLNCSDSEKILYKKETSTTSHRPEENEQEREGEIRDEDKGAGEISSITSICKRTMPKNKTRCSKKDRHSKINTARGPRDRRMRLSLDAARKFFKLQDMLGFDKASKTIEWLLVKSKSEIEELVNGIGGAAVPQMNKQRCTSAGITGAISSTTSSSDGSKVADNIAIASDEFSSNDKKTKGPSSNKEKKAKTARRVAFHILTKESRNKARTKARERTKLKRSLGKSKLCYEAMAHDLNILGSNWRPSMNCEKPVAVEVEDHSTSNDSSSEVNGKWNQFTIFNYQQNSGIFHEHQLTDLQFCGKLWEA